MVRACDSDVILQTLPTLGDLVAEPTSSTLSELEQLGTLAGRVVQLSSSAGATTLADHAGRVARAARCLQGKRLLQAAARNNELLSYLQSLQQCLASGLMPGTTSRGQVVALASPIA